MEQDHEALSADVRTSFAIAAVAAVAATRSSRLQARMDAGPEAAGWRAAASTGTTGDPHGPADAGDGAPAQAGERAPGSGHPQRSGQPPAASLYRHHAMGRRQPEPAGGGQGDGRQAAPVGRALERAPRC